MTTEKTAPASESILVVGGGISGLTTAIEAAEVGYEVFLVEKNPYLGGRVAQLNQYFPKLCPPTCGLEINFRRIKDNPRVQVLTMAEVEKIDGKPGNYDNAGFTENFIIDYRDLVRADYQTLLEMCSHGLRLGNRQAFH